MKTTSATRRRYILFLAVLLLSAGSLIAESGSFVMVFRDGGPFKVKQALGGGSSHLNFSQSSDATTWPDFSQVVWPLTEIRPAPARGQVQGLVFVNDFDPAIQAQARSYDDMQAHLRECAGVAMIAASRPGKYFLEVLVAMSDTSQSWVAWGSTGTVWRVNMAPDTKLTCTLRTNS